MVTPTSCPRSTWSRTLVAVARSVRGPWRKRQLRPTTCSRRYPVCSRNPPEAYTIGLSSSDGSVMQKLRCAPCTSRISVTSFFVNDGPGATDDADDAPPPRSVSLAAASSPPASTSKSEATSRNSGCARRMSFSAAFSRSSAATCCCSDSKKNFFRSRVRRARIRFRSRRRSICACVLLRGCWGSSPAPCGAGSRGGAGGACATVFRLFAPPSTLDEDGFFFFVVDRADSAPKLCAAAGTP
mmetsp:Transcript_6051/g.19000  ORF Transcript_6051/g.19000 Transcript_6051/m.19000 type:complete len:241 (+) Transcript_6051:816-1538(+)